MERQINKNPRIIMSTIHGAKGGEADKVLLMQDITNAALETFSYDPDELHRLFYTGATRTKRELHIVDPRDFDRGLYIMKTKKLFKRTAKIMNIVGHKFIKKFVRKTGIN